MSAATVQWPALTNGARTLRSHCGDYEIHITGALYALIYLPGQTWCTHDVVDVRRTLADAQACAQRHADARAALEAAT